MKRKIGFALLVALLAVLMACVMTVIGARVKLYRNVNPRGYAAKNSVWMRRTLKLTPDQTQQVHDILLDHKVAMNRLDREELERWERIFQSLPNDSDADLRRHMEALNELAARRNELRFRTLLTLRQQLNDPQKKNYGQAVSEAVHKYLEMLARIFG